jgi:hypothetical protein
MKCAKETELSELAEALALYLNKLSRRHLKGKELYFVNVDVDIHAIIGEVMLFSWRADRIVNSIDFSRDETVLDYLRYLLDACKLLSNDHKPAEDI